MKTADNIADIAQRKEALQLDRSFIVSAPAGSGKTTLLIERYLASLIKSSPEEVIAITFTKKAAAEMKLRLINALENPDNKSPNICKLAKEACKLSNNNSWNILQNPEKIKICTIDSLCHEIASTSDNNAIENLNICSDPEPLYLQATADMLSNYASTPWEKSIIEVLNHIGNDFEKLQKLLIEMLRSRDIWLPLISSTASADDLKEVIQNSIQDRKHNVIALLQGHFPKELKPSAKKLFSLYPKALEADIPRSKEAIDWKLFADFMLTSQNTVRKRVTKEIGIAPASSASNGAEKEALKQLKLEATDFFTKMSGHTYFIQLLVMLRHMPTEFYSDHEWQDLNNIMQIMPIAAAHLNIAFEKSSQCDFIAVNLASMEALGSIEAPSDLAISLSNKLSHILVDEFQDTSLSQLELLKKLTISWEPHEEKSLFLVGDPMQSIYKFRQADITIFLSLIDSNLGNIKLNHLSLSVNFRSTNKVVDWVNGLFSKLFSAKHIPNTQSPSFSKAEAYNKDNTSSIEFNITLDSDETYQNELIAKKIAKIIPSGESIAVLVRSRNHLQNLSAILDKNNISYTQEDIIPLTKIQAAIDIAHLYLALSNFSNKISWASLLASPLCGLKYSSIHAILSVNKELTVWEAANKPNSLSESEQIRLKYFLNIIAHAIQKKSLMREALWLEDTWLILGGPNFIDAASTANSISKLFNSLQDIPTTWPKWQQLLASRYIANDNITSQVTIMTIHKAKGLEFDHVFLPAFNKKPPVHRSSLLNWSYEHNNLIISPIASDSSNKSEIHSYLNYIAKIQNINEDIRVLYVAATRAKKQLYIYANAKADNENNIIISNNSSFMHLTWQHLKESHQQTTNYFKSATFSHKEPQNHTSKIAALEHLQKISLTANINNYEHNCDFDSDNYHTIRGTIIHKYIEKIASLDLKISDINIAEISSNLVADITESDLDRSLIRQMKTEIISILHDFINTPFAAWILDPDHKMSQNEYAITVKTEHSIKNMVIDRTFIDEDNNRWIIDYKTSSKDPSDFEEFAAAQKDKYYNQLLEYAQAFREENRNTICCLYFIPLQKYLTFNV